MKLGVIYEPDSANAFYRAVIPLRELERRGHAIVWPEDPVKIPLREFASCDLVHCYRRMDRLDDLRRLSERGVAITFDNDDNYAAAEASDGGTGLRGRHHNRGLFRLVLQAARLADLTTTTNEPLAEVYRAAGVERVAVIDNHLDRRSFGFGHSSKHDGVVVGWVAGREHSLDLERLPVLGALERLLEAHPKVRVVTVGLRLPLSSDRYRHVDEVPFRDLLRATSELDVGIAPLADTPFNRCRSAVKLKEYGAGVCAWAASPVGPYRGLGARQGGVLVADDGWFSALDELIRHPRRRKRLAKQALRWTREQAIDRRVEQWERAFGEAVERAARRMRERRSHARVAQAR